MSKEIASEHEEMLKPKRIPFALEGQAQIAFEEKIHSRALHLLSSLTFSGISTQLDEGVQKQVYIPAPIFLSLATTLSLHPDYTTALVKGQTASAGYKATQYLHNAVRLVGATNAGLQDAWTFKRDRASKHAAIKTNRKLRHRSATPPREKKRIIAEGEIKPFDFLDIAHDESLFASCEDIWDVIGWAFTCSVLHRKRWARWKQWLELVCDAVTGDWEERLEQSVDGRVSEPDASLASAIGFLPNMDGSSGYKRAIKAIMANGNAKNMWQPVFQYEVEKRPRKGKHGYYESAPPSAAPSRKMTDKDKYDYDWILDKVGQKMDDVSSDEDTDEDPDPPKFNDANGDSQMNVEEETPPREDASAAWGGMESVVLRLRLMCLVITLLPVWRWPSRYLSLETAQPCSMRKKNTATRKTDVSDSSADLNMTLLSPTQTLMMGGAFSAPYIYTKLSLIFRPEEKTLENLYDEFAGHVRLLPVREMMLFTTSIIGVNVDVCSSFYQAILRPFIPQPSRGYEDDMLSQKSLMGWYLPHAAMSKDPEVNAKVSVLVEALMRLFEKYRGLVWSEELKKAVEAGTAARYNKAEGLVWSEEQNKMVAEKNKKKKTNHDEMMNIINGIELRMDRMLQIAKLRMKHSNKIVK